MCRMGRQLEWMDEWVCGTYLWCHIMVFMVVHTFGVTLWYLWGTYLWCHIMVFVAVQRAPPIIRRWVPFVAVAAANCINIPVMRQRELIEGIIVTDKEGNDLAKSKVSPSGLST